MEVEFGVVEADGGGEAAMLVGVSGSVEVEFPVDEGKGVVINVSVSASGEGGREWAAGPWFWTKDSSES